MPKLEEKQKVVNEIKDKLSNAKSVVLVDGRGLTVEQDTNLRKQLRDSSVDYKVYKNKLVNLAIKGTDFEGLVENLAGPTALAICYDDASIAARIINKAIDSAPALEFKAGVFDGTYYDAVGVKAIAEIPSKDELLSKLLGSFKSPMSSFARVINAVAEKNGEVA